MRSKFQSYSKLYNESSQLFVWYESLSVNIFLYALSLDRKWIHLSRCYS